MKQVKLRLARLCLHEQLLGYGKAKVYLQGKALVDAIDAKVKGAATGSRKPAVNDLRPMLPFS